MNAWLVAAGAVLAAAVVGYVLWRVFRKPDAYIYVPEGTPTAQWRYQQLKMVKCEWCGKEVSLQRHHIIPWSAAPELEHEPQNLVVLCKDDHLHVAHGGNYKRFNANLRATLDSKKWVVSNEYYKETHDGKDRTEIRK